VHGVAGDDDNPGTRERPRRSIQSAVDLLAGLGFHGEVRVAEGTYPITAPLVVASGIALRGGYDESGWDQRDIEVYETVFAGSGVEHVVGFAAQAGESTLLEGFVVRAAPATTLKPGGMRRSTRDLHDDTGMPAVQFFKRYSTRQ